LLRCCSAVPSVQSAGGGGRTTSKILTECPAPPPPPVPYKLKTVTEHYNKWKKGYVATFTNIMAHPGAEETHSPEICFSDVATAHLRGVVKLHDVPIRWHKKPRYDWTFWDNPKLPYDLWYSVRPILLCWKNTEMSELHARLPAWRSATSSKWRHNIPKQRSAGCPEILATLFSGANPTQFLFRYFPQRWKIWEGKNTKQFGTFFLHGRVSGKRQKSIALMRAITNGVHTELHYGTKTLSLVLSLLATFHFCTPLVFVKLIFETAQIMRLVCITRIFNMKLTHT
jgi:hypothetical protein